jgi:hypothetical protein
MNLSYVSPRPGGEPGEGVGHPVASCCCHVLEKRKGPAGAVTGRTRGERRGGPATIQDADWGDPVPGHQRPEPSELLKRCVEFLVVALKWPFR